MRPQLRRLRLHQIRRDVLDDPLSNCHRQTIDNQFVNRRLSRERPSVNASSLHHLRDSLRQLLADPAVCFRLEPHPIAHEKLHAVDLIPH